MADDIKRIEPSATKQAAAKFSQRINAAQTMLRSCSNRFDGMKPRDVNEDIIFGMLDKALDHAKQTCRASELMCSEGLFVHAKAL